MRVTAGFAKTASWVGAAASARAEMTSTPPPEAPRPGDVLASKYRVERVLGMGGMGVVVAAHHLELETQVALKFMLKAPDDGEAAVRFLREARAAAKLRSEHAARVTDFGKLETGAPYIVIEYLAGEDLGDLLRREGPLPLGLATRCIVQACEAIQEAHEQGIVHRDIKPSNLFLTRRPNGQPCIKVLDFGISKLTLSTSDPAGLQSTSTGAVFGSPMYMAPEQMRSARRASPRSDVWSLGATLYELLTGTLPFVAETVMELALKVAEELPPAPSALRASLPPELDAIVLRCLEKDPEQRFASARELAQALAPFAEDAQPNRAQSTPELAAPARFSSDMPTLTQATWGGPRPLKRGPQRLVIPALIGAGLGVLTVAVWLTTRPTSEQPPTSFAHEAPASSAATPSAVASEHPEVESAIEAAPIAVVPSSTPATSASAAIRPARPQPKAKPKTKPRVSDDPFADPR